MGITTFVAKDSFEALVNTNIHAKYPT